MQRQHRLDDLFLALELVLGRAWVGARLPTGGARFPEITGKLSYDADKKVFTMPVSLKPNWEYRFSLNSAKYNSFRSQDGFPLKPIRVTFRTGDAR